MPLYRSRNPSHGAGSLGACALLLLTFTACNPSDESAQSAAASQGGGAPLPAAPPEGVPPKAPDASTAPPDASGPEAPAPSPSTEPTEDASLAPHDAGSNEPEPTDAGTPTTPPDATSPPSEPAPGTDTNCGAAACFLTVPLLPGTDISLTNYRDQDPNPGTFSDFRGGTVTYDGHSGVDFAIANYRAMDRGVPVVAAAPGTVIDAKDEFFDRNSEIAGVGCFPKTNLVELQHPDGYTTKYWHLKRGSVTVELGQVVDRGEQLGEVGSSGCSQSPHVHLQLTPPEGGSVSPFFAKRWVSEPDLYITSLRVMDTVLANPEFSDLAAFWEAAPNPENHSLNERLSVGAVTAGGQEGQRLTIEVESPTGQITELERVYQGSERLFARWWRVVPDEVGIWSFRYLVDGEVGRTENLNVAP